jgi:hypothetical protein
MRTIQRLIVVSLFIVCSFTVSVAQEMDFTLATGRMGEVYQQSIERVLADKYGVRLESGAQAAAFEWAAVENLPAGLKLNNDGTITGVPQSHQAQPYRFKLKVTDRAMRDAEALELNFSIQLMPPRIRLVKNNAPRLVPVYSAPEQASLPAALTSAAPAESAANGDGNPVATSESVAAQPVRESRLALPEAPIQRAANMSNADAQLPANDAGASQMIGIHKYIDIVEETSGGNKYVLNVAEKAADATGRRLAAKTGTEDILDRFDNINFRLRSDRESNIVIKKTPSEPAACLDKAGQNNPLGMRFIVSAELVRDNGTTPLTLTGDSLESAIGQSAAIFRPGSLPVALGGEDSLAILNLKESDAEANDHVRLMVEAVCASANRTDEAKVMGKRKYDIELTDFGWESGVSPSVFLINRHSVRRIDEQPSTTTTTPNSLTNPINSVNYSPFTGASYVFSYKGEERSKGTRFGKLFSFLQPGFGVNATFMDFNDQTIDFQNPNLQNFQDRIFDKDSDVQLGIGAVATFFGNKIQITYGGNLAVDRKRGYFGFGLDFLKLFGLFQ